MYCNCHSGQVDLICFTPFPPSLLFYWELKVIVYLLESPRKNASDEGGDLFYFDILLGWDGGGASFVNQSQRSKVKPKQSKVTFDTKLKTALIVIIVISVKMKAIFPVMNTAWAVVKIRPKKKFRPVRDLKPRPFYQALFSLLLKWCSLLRRSLLYSRLYPQFKYMTFIYSQSFIVMSVAFFISGDIINLIYWGFKDFNLELHFATSLLKYF